MEEILKSLLDWYGSLTAIGRVILWCVLAYAGFRVYYIWDNKKLNDKIDD